MRRGHPGIGGWRNENPRHFRPRTGATPRFRPPRLYSLLDGPRLPPPRPILNRGKHPYNTHSTHSEEHGRADHHDRNNYRNQVNPYNLRLQEGGHQQRPRHNYSYVNPNLIKENNTQSSAYKHPSNFFNEGQGDSFHINSLGDIDHRQLGNVQHSQDDYNPHRINPWTQADQRHFYEDRNPQLYYRPHETDRQHTEGNKIPSLDYTGHRPPSSDYYGSTSSTTVNNNNTSFSRSVDDTVDIVRKRLMNRNEPQTMPQDDSVAQSSSEQEITENANQQAQQELPTKKRIQRQRQNVKSNCDKMKTNIVHQLFKMDKDKMHKLMDDPGSSSKFEYAISSLITESQNSLNRHLRSVAEKSLASSSNDFIHNDNNTIYEDTFMKQMQCLLDPQDTVLLEDIKPLVMAELSKVLQLDDFESRYDAGDPGNQMTREDYNNDVYQQNENQHYENYNYDEYQQEAFYDNDRGSASYSDSARIDTTDSAAQNFNYNIKEENYESCGTLFERRTSRRSVHDQDDRRHSIDSQRRRKSVDKPAEVKFSPTAEPLPLFDSNTEQLSEDEDTFAELDKQYHVAVDHNFLDDLSARTTPNYTQQIDVNQASIKNEIDYQLHSFAESSLNFPSSANNDVDDRQLNAVHVKQEVFQSPDFPKENSTPVNSDNISSRIEHISIKQEHAVRAYKDVVSEGNVEKSKSSSVSKTSPSNSRKRSIDQRPSHRKEKRKKSESSSSDVGRTSSHRHNDHNSKDRHSKSTDKYQNTHKPYYSIFNSKDESRKEISRDNKRNDTAEKGYSDKYVKRKESRKSNDRDSHKKRSSSSSSQTILSPKDSCNNTSVTPTKGDPKAKLKSIDMFVEQTKKVSVHQSHRNTATAPTTTPVTVKTDEKPKQVMTPPCKVAQTKHASTQVIKRVISKETQTFETKNLSSKHCQTEKTKVVSKGIQTIRVDDERRGSNKPKTKSSDAFERMKEIDMEIQELLQEKFKLYNNLESKNAGPHAEQSYLSMTVLNVANIDDQATVDDQEHNDSATIKTANTADENEGLDDKTEVDESINSDSNADAILDDFTNIPVEELEQIAFESVDNANFSKTDKRSARRKALQQERMNSESPKSTSSRKSTKKAKTPNICLLEQIITDERPLEDIISLHDLESTPTHKKRSHRSKPKKKSSKKSKSVRSIDISSYGLKECSVVLIQTDISKYIQEKSEPEPVEVEHFHILEPFKGCTLEYKESPERQKISEPHIVEESVVNDLQFDMLDVSEDIVIGESCEIKDKDSNEHVVTVSEDLILDNSQSSADDAFSADVGQTENECKTYDYSTDEELRRDSLTVTGNVDSVLAIECIESDFVAACLDGNVYHFSGDGQLLNTMRGSNLAVTCLTIVKEKYGTTVYTGSLDSRIRYYDLDTGLEKGPECNVLSPIQTMDRAWDTVFVGTRTGFVLQFECKNNMLIPVSTVKFSEQAILALRALKEGPRKVLLVASRSENVTVKDAQTGLLLRTLAGPMMTVYTLLFEDGKVYCGTSSHQIHVFDYASGSHTGCHEGGKGAVCLRATGGLLFAGCYDGCVYVYREGETRPLAQLRGPSLMLLSLAVVGSKIIAGYKDRSLYIWKIPLSILQEMIL